MKLMQWEMGQKWFGVNNCQEGKLSHQEERQPLKKNQQNATARRGAAKEDAAKRR
jgi:hypothetical protein